MLKPLIEMLFGCQHSKLTWPQSPRREGRLNRFRRQEPAKITCLDCGAEFEYDWRRMRVGKRIYPVAHQHPDVRPTLDAKGEA